MEVSWILQWQEKNETQQNVTEQGEYRQREETNNSRKCFFTFQSLSVAAVRTCTDYATMREYANQFIHFVSSATPQHPSRA